MATNIVTNATVNISVNGQDAEQTLDNLRKRVKNVQEEIIRMRSAGVNRKDPKLQALYREYEDLSRMLRTCEREATAVDHVMRRLDTASPKELRAALKQLNRELETLHRGSEEWKRQTEQIRRVQAALNSVNSELREQEGRWSRMNRWLNDQQTLIAGVAAALTGLILAARKSVKDFLEMDQEMANVQKYTGMTSDQVKVLNERFKEIDTRAGRDELNKLAQEAGRLGKTSEADVLGFVNAAQKINVALDDLGDGATLKLSKLTGIFGDEERLGTEKALLSVGSVINELSQNCSASAPYLAQFASRMGGVAAQAGMTIQQVMALGAVLDTTNQGVEAASTAVSQVITRLYQDTAKYAKVAGLDVKEFSDLLKRDANAAFITFLETLKNAGGMDTLSPMFADMGENGARAIAALSSLATHIEEVKSQQEAANEAFAQAISIDKEFEVQNTTLLAEQEKAMKRCKELAIEVGEKIQPMMRYVYSSSSLMLKALNELITFVTSNYRIILTLTAAVAGYTAAVTLATIRTKALAAAHTAGGVIMKGWRATMLLTEAAISLCTGRITKATVAFKAFSAAIKANPLGLLVAAVAAVTTALINLATKTDEYRKSMDDAMGSATSFAEELDKEMKSIDRLFGKLDAAKKGTEEYNKARNAIISKYGVYLKGLVNEAGEITNLTTAYERLAFAARKSAQARGIDKAKENIETTYRTNETEQIEILRKNLSKLGMNDRQLARLMTSISMSLGSEQGISEADLREIRAFTAKNRGLWETMTTDDPVKIALGLSHNQIDYKNRVKNLDDMDPRLFKGIGDDELNRQIEALTKALQETPTTSKEVEISVEPGLIDKLNSAMNMNLLDNENKRERKLNLMPDELSLQKNGAQSILPGIPGLGTKEAEKLGRDFGESAVEEFKKIPAPLKNAGKSVGILSREQLENLQRELLYEKSQRNDVTPGTPDVEGLTGGTGYKSQKELDKEAQKRAAEEKAALLKARKEFRDGLNAIRAEMESEEAAIIGQYSRGEIKYLDYLEKRKGNEALYYDRSREYYEEHFKGLRDYELSEDKDYQKLLSDKEGAMMRYENKILALNESVLKRQMEAEIRDAERRSALIENRTIADEEELSQKKLKIQVDYLQARMKLYNAGSDEWEKIQTELDDVQEKDRYEREKRFQERIREARNKYELLSVSERYEVEKRAVEAVYQLRKRKLEALRAADKITREEFDEEIEKANEELQKILEKLKRQNKDELPGSDYERTPKEIRKGKEKRIADKNDEIDKAYNSGMISGEEANRMKAKVLKDELADVNEELENCKSEWVSLIAQMSYSWMDLWDSIDKGGDVFRNLEKVAETTFAVITAGMQIASEFAQANAKIEMAAIEKRYDREIELAQGNTYLTKKLEEEKERKVAEIKNKAADAEFKMAVIQATGTMIMGAMNAYTSTLKIPIVGPALAPAAAAVAMAAGAANLALLTKQQEASAAQGYSEGGYTGKGNKDDVAGVVHAGEWVAPAWMLDNPETAGLIERLEVVRNSGVAGRAFDVMRDNVTRQNITGSLTHSDVDRITGVGAAITTARLISSGSETVSGKRGDRITSDRSSATDKRDGDQELRSVIKRLTDRLDEPFVTVNTMTGRYGIKATEEEYKRLMKNRRRS